jgi:hypothetical protein
MQIVESIYRVLFGAIVLTDDQRGRAMEILIRLQAEQTAQTQAMIAAVQASMPARAAIQAQRDSSLRALITSPTDRATFDSRLGPPSGGRSAGPGGRSGGPGGGPSVTVIDLMYHRLFDGIAMSPETEASARAIIEKAQSELSGLLPPPQPPRLQLRPQLGLVVMQPEGESALASVLGSDADRATLHARISTVPIGDRPRQP